MVLADAKRTTLKHFCATGDARFVVLAFDNLLCCKVPRETMTHPSSHTRVLFLSRSKSIFIPNTFTLAEERTR